MFRVSFGVLASVIDLLTDAYVIAKKFNDEKMGYFNASVASLAVSIGLQLFMVFLQNKK